uniref:Uncharacterized protein n=1 Tax=Rhizophora mucronata TaxID=61149 RepID=A0A2P2NK14_RHIMU
MVYMHSYIMYCACLFFSFLALQCLCCLRSILVVTADNASFCHEGMVAG